MKERKANISTSKKGMNRSSSPEQLKKGEYVFAKNINVETIEGDLLNIVTEPSNVLAAKVKKGYKIFFVKRDRITERTYLFLKNEETGHSEIGYISNEEYTENDDILEDCSDCNYNQIDRAPLEEIDQQTYLTYKTLINDECVVEIEDGLNFSLEHPIKSCEIKFEKGATVMYFCDGFNKDRYIDITNIDKYYVNVVPCEDNTTQNCPDFSLMNIDRNYEPIIKNSVEVIKGGNLAQGEAEFFAYYCTKNGQIMSNPFRITNKISLFNEREIVRTQEDYASNSNKSIKIDLQSIDQRFEAYKLLLVHTTSVQSVVQRVYEVGIMPINKNSIIVSQTDNLKESALEEIFQRKIDLESSNMMESSNDILYRYKLEPKDEINLQPVVNLMGSLLEWQTSVAKEGLYKAGEGKEGYLGYNRNEVVPLSIVFNDTSGFETAPFPFVSRPPIANEKEILDPETDKNAKSFKKTKDGDIERWEVYNTATLEGDACNKETIEKTTVRQSITRYCKVENVQEDIGQGGSGGDILIDISNDDYTGFIDFVDNLEEIDCPDVQDNGGNFCSNLFPANEPGGGCDVFGDLNLVDGSEEKYWSLEIGSIENLQENFIEKDFPTGYKTLLFPEYCNIYDTGDDGPGNDKHWIFKNGDLFIYKRNQQIYETSPNTATTLQPTSDIQSNTIAYNINYNFGFAESDMYTNVTAETLTHDLSSFNLAANELINNSTYQYKNLIAKNAKWFLFDGKEEGNVLSLSQDNQVDRDDATTISYRVSIYYSSTSSTPVFSFIKEPQEIANIRIRKTNDNEIGIKKDNQTEVIVPVDIENIFYVAIDTPVFQNNGVLGNVSGSDQRFLVQDDNGDLVMPNYVGFSSAGCFSAALREIEYKQVRITYDKIIYDKLIKKTAVAEFQQPIVKEGEVYNHKKGKLAYNESVEEYPDNKDLYDSSIINITSQDLQNLPSNLQTDFENYYLDNSYNWKEENGKPLVDFRCKNIRHPKMPDNSTTPFMENAYEKAPFAETIVYPLGFNIEPKVVETFLDIAYKNDLITYKQRKDLIGYKILRGDLTKQRRVVTSGLLYNARKYNYEGKDILYNNYPFNSLDADKLNNIDNRLSGNNDTYSNFFFNSPEADYYSDISADDILIEGYTYGNSKGEFDEVEDHPKWTILSNKAKRLASKLALAEVVSEVAIKAAQALSNQWQVVGVANGFSLGSVGAAIILAFETLTAAAFKYGRFRYEWLNTFKNLGPVENFAYYYYAEGFYNNFALNTLQENRIRHLDINIQVKAENSSIVNKLTGDKIRINNKRREESTFISVAGEDSLQSDYRLEYPDLQKQYDQGFNSSLFYAGEIGLNLKGRSEEILKNISSPYASFVKYLPNQHGQINSINWLDTNYYNKIGNQKCQTIFGGDTYITRHTFKKKMPFFLRDAFNLGDLQPFDYKFYANIEENDTKPRFYASYELDAEDSVNIGGSIFPEIPTNFSFDEHTRKGNYVRPPSKFYLFYYGIPNFLTETRINTDYRVARENDRERFYPEIGDLNYWTQEKNVPIDSKEYFFYNNVYSSSNIEAVNKTLPNYFDNKKNKKRQNLDNFLIYSTVDKDQESYEDPWLIYRPLDYKQLPTKFGQLNKITSLEDEVLLAIFDDTNILYNRVDSTVDEGSNPSPFLGGGDVFRRRSVNFKNTEIGAGGSQNHNSILFDYGHVHIDAKRGQIIFTGRGGKKSEDISKSFDGKDLGMRHWFKKHLPFKIKKFFDVDTDNISQGFGLSLGWDSRNERLFLTKKDFVPLDKNIVFEDNKFKLNGTEVSIYNSELFEDVSFTVSFSFKTMSWISYYDFKPDFYISQNNYFQTTDRDGNIWSHLVTNKSSRVFNGKAYKSVIEYPIKGSVSSKRLLNIKLKTEFKYYLTYNDFSLRDDKTFSSIVVFNRRECSGKLNLDVMKSHSLSHKYPKTNNDSQDIIATSDNDMFNVNYIFNRVNKINNNQPIFLWDKNQIEKSINNSKVNFKPKPVLEYMRGNWFTVRAEKDGDTNGFLTFMYNLSEEERYL